MTAYQGHGSVATPHGILITWALMTEGGIQVNERGERFANEHAGYSEACLPVLRQPGGVAWCVYDERLHQLAMTFPDYRDAHSAGAIRNNFSCMASTAPWQPWAICGGPRKRPLRARFHRQAEALAAVLRREDHGRAVPHARRPGGRRARTRPRARPCRTSSPAAAPPAACPARSCGLSVRQRPALGDYPGTDRRRQCFGGGRFSMKASMPSRPSSCAKLARDHARSELVGLLEAEVHLLVERALAGRDWSPAASRRSCAASFSTSASSSSAGTTRLTRPHSSAAARVDRLAREQHLHRVLALQVAADRDAGRRAEEAPGHAAAWRTSPRRRPPRGRTARRAGSRPPRRRPARARSPAAAAPEWSASCGCTGRTAPRSSAAPSARGSPSGRARRRSPCPAPARTTTRMFRSLHQRIECASAAPTASRRSAGSSAAGGSWSACRRRRGLRAAGSARSAWGSRSCVDRRGGLRLLAQHELLDLAGRGLRAARRTPPRAAP